MLQQTSCTQEQSPHRRRSHSHYCCQCENGTTSGRMTRRRPMEPPGGRESMIARGSWDSNDTSRLDIQATSHFAKSMLMA